MIILMNSTQTRINNKKKNNNNEREDNKILYVRLCNNRRKEEEGWRKYSDEKGKSTHVKNRQGNGLVSSSSTESTSQNEFFGSYFIGI